MNQKAEKNPVNKRKLQANATREKIYKTAFDLITNLGFDNVSVDQICEESGVAKGSFYHHFRSKDDIVIETYKNVDRDYTEEIMNLPGDIGCVERIIVTVKFQARYAKMKGVSFVKQIYKSQLDTGTQFFISEERPFFKLIQETIETGQENGELRADIASDVMTRLVLSISRGITYDWCLRDGSYDIEEIMEHFFRSLLPAFQS